MTGRGIIQNADQVRALLDGRRTQARVRLKKQPVPYTGMASGRNDFAWPTDTPGCFTISCKPNGPDGWAAENCPYGQPGDMLYVREAWAYGLCTKTTLAYRATHKPQDLDEGWDEKIKWQSGAQMPRSESRITLRITSVRIERLQDISEADAEAEGAFSKQQAADIGMAWRFGSKQQFSDAWRKHYGDGSWNANPWVWVLEYEVIHANVDTVIKEAA